eukprot:14414885-Heterocapsa_arctica.AAC.1
MKVGRGSPAPSTPWRRNPSELGNHKKQSSCLSLCPATQQSTRPSTPDSTPCCAVLKAYIPKWLLLWSSVLFRRHRHQLDGGLGTK